MSIEAHPSSNLEELKKSVVKIEVSLPNNKETGAGIIVAADTEKVYIMTAYHVIHEFVDTDSGDKTINIQFFSNRQKSVPGEVFKRFDEDLDLAVVTVKKQDIKDFEIIPINEIGDVKKVKELEEIITIGHPGSTPWGLAKGNVSKIQTNYFLFSGNAVYPGNSGGMLLNRGKYLIGMVIGRGAEIGRALRIDVAFDKLRDEWGIPVAVKAIPISPDKPWWKNKYFIAVAVVVGSGTTGIILYNLSKNPKDNPVVLDVPPYFPGEEP